jgi:hypothetical protein
MSKPHLLLAGVLFISLVAISALAANAQTREISSFAPLRNEDVLMMVERKHPPEAIITIMKFSQCNFDTFPPVLQDLKNRGVPGEVLQAMVEAPYGPSTESKNNDDLAEQPIYHYAEQLKQMGLLTALPTGRRAQSSRRQDRARASRPPRRRA